MPKPIVRPVNIAAAAAPKHLKPKKRLPKWLTTGVPLIPIAVAAVVLGIQWLTVQSQNDARLDQLGQMNPPRGRPDDVPLLLGYS